MSKNKPAIALLLVQLVVLAGSPVARAADEPTSAEETFLKGKGLTRHDRKFLLEEAPAVDKYQQARSLYTDYQKALGRSTEIAQYDEAVQAMQMEQQALQQQVNALQMQIRTAG